MSCQTFSPDLTYCKPWVMAEVDAAAQKVHELYTQFLRDEPGTQQSKSSSKLYRELMRRVFGTLDYSASLLTVCVAPPAADDYFGLASCRPHWHLNGTLDTGDFQTSGSPFTDGRVGPAANAFHFDDRDGWTSPPPILRPAPFLARTHVTALHAAVRRLFDGARPVFELIREWMRRYEGSGKTAKADKRPLRQLFSIDRSYQALMRFVFGFFGSHKVDARNNP